MAKKNPAGQDSPASQNSHEKLMLAWDYWELDSAITSVLKTHWRDTPVPGTNYSHRVIDPNVDENRRLLRSVAERSLKAGALPGYQEDHPIANPTLSDNVRIEQVPFWYVKRDDFLHFAKSKGFWDPEDFVLRIESGHRAEGIPDCFQNSPTNVSVIDTFKKAASDVLAWEQFHTLQKRVSEQHRGSKTVAWTRIEPDKTIAEHGKEQDAKNSLLEACSKLLGKYRGDTHKKPAFIALTQLQFAIENRQPAGELLSDAVAQIEFFNSEPNATTAEQNTPKAKTRNEWNRLAGEDLMATWKEMQEERSNTNQMVSMPPFYETLSPEQRERFEKIYGPYPIDDGKENALPSPPTPLILTASGPDTELPKPSTPPEVDKAADTQPMKKVATLQAPSVILNPQPHRWADVTMWTDDREDGILVRVKNGKRQGTFYSAEKLGFTSKRGKAIKAWNVFYNSLDALKEMNGHRCATIAYSDPSKKSVTRKRIEEIKRLLSSAFGIDSPAFRSTVRSKNSRYDGTWLSEFNLPIDREDIQDEQLARKDFVREARESSQDL